ncbi:Autophagy protein 22 [Actinomortierella ambigua]|nr:Autophagy protein 22 [Actinomortierella ambigua]
MYPKRLSKIEPLDSLVDIEKEEYKVDVVPLSRSEKIAWYIQNATICGFGWIAYPMYVPMIVMDISSKYGVQASNHTLPCDLNVPQPACEAYLFGHYLDPGTVSLYLSSFCSVFSFLCSLSISPVADHGAYRKRFMVIFSIIGGLCAIGFLLIEIPHMYWIIGVLSPIAWACYNVVNVYSHAYLPIFGRVHPRVLTTEAQGGTKDEILRAEERALNDLSAYSVAWGNIGALLIQGVCVTISHFMHDSSLSLEIAIAFAGAWWLGWQLAVAPWMHPRPGPPLPEAAFKTVASVRQLPQIFKFMLCWFMLSDGVGTLLSVIFLITYRELGFTHTDSMVITMVLTILASGSAYLFMRVRQYWHLSTKALIMTCLWLYLAISLYLSITPLFTDKIGLRHGVESWAAVVYMGCIVSTFYGSARVMLSELSPPGDESEWFSLYLLADKGSSWIGPLVTAWVYNTTHKYRVAFWFPTTLIAVGMLILWSVDIPKGKEEARAFAKEKRRRLELD